jgi:hypothetical protein
MNCNEIIEICESKRNWREAHEVRCGGVAFVCAGILAHSSHVLGRMIPSSGVPDGLRITKEEIRFAAESFGGNSIHAVFVVFISLVIRAESALH